MNTWIFLQDFEESSQPQYVKFHGILSYFTILLKNIEVQSESTVSQVCKKP